MENRIENAIMGALVADSYALGVHWIYDTAQLDEMRYDWGALHAPIAPWHEGKRKGDFTHYGDQMVWLVEYLQRCESFDSNAYAQFWRQKMQSYKGYIDGASKAAMHALEEGNPPACGPASADLSIVGRIAPLVTCGNDVNTFTSNAILLAKITHNSREVLESTAYMATVLWEVLQGVSIVESVTQHRKKFGTFVAQAYEHAQKLSSISSIEAIRTLGNACAIEGGLAGVLHLLLGEGTYEERMRANAQAGGDSAARGMVVGMLLGAAGVEMPLSWKKSLRYELGTMAPKLLD